MQTDSPEVAALYLAWEMTKLQVKPGGGADEINQAIRDLYQANYEAIWAAFKETRKAKSVRVR